MKSDLSQLACEFRDFIQSDIGRGLAQEEGRQAWPVTLSTEEFQVNGKTFDTVQMDESFKFYVSLSSDSTSSEVKVGRAPDFDVSQMIVAARKAIVTVSAASH